MLMECRVGAVVEQDCDNILGALEHGSKSTDPVKEMLAYIP